MELKNSQKIKQTTEYLDATFGISHGNFAIGIRYIKGIDSCPVIIGVEEDQAAETLKKLFTTCQIPIIHHPKLAEAVYYYLFFKEEGENRNVALPGQLFEDVSRVLKKLVAKWRNNELVPDGKKRCTWCQGQSTLTVYHDFLYDRYFDQTDQHVMNALVFEMYAQQFGRETTLGEEDLMASFWADYDVSLMGEKQLEDGAYDVLAHVVENAKMNQTIISLYGDLSSFLSQLPPKEEEKIELIARLYKGVSKQTAREFLQAIGVISLVHDEKCFMNSKKKA